MSRRGKTLTVSTEFITMHILTRIALNFAGAIAFTALAWAWLEWKERR